MRRVVSISCLCFAWFCANGTIWDALQVAAWAKMFANYTASMSVGKAIAQTFDARNACEMCHVAQTGQDNARDESAPVNLGSGLEKILLISECTETPVATPVRDHFWPGVADDSGLTRFERVPVPPPRV